MEEAEIETTQQGIIRLKAFLTVLNFSDFLFWREVFGLKTLRQLHGCLPEGSSLQSCLRSISLFLVYGLGGSFFLPLSQASEMLSTAGRA